MISASELDDRTARSLAASIVRQAVDDWRCLCKGEYGKERCNFNELDDFFKHDCCGYISEESARRIYDKLRLERKRLLKWWTDE